MTDSLQRLWTPHRMAYIDSNKAPQERGCPFCQAPTQNDEESLIIHRGRTCFAILNLFPYNPGHVLVCPYRHVGDLTDLSNEELGEVASLTVAAMKALRKDSAPAGFNIGINQGVAGGAGVVDHFHQHVVPRWVGDANFFPIIAETKAIPQLLGETRARLARVWDLT